jgi:DtxR family Mn-dependent transcriptional regulator
MANLGKQRASVSESVGDYLKAIWIIGGSEPVSTQNLADHLGISAPSVSGMLVRLHEQGLVHHERYYGVTLTDDGMEVALRLVRRHRLIETFLVTHMNYSWDEVHEEAEILEHAVSDRFVERLDSLLGHPTHDPHGDPIPSPEGSVPLTPDVQLSEAGEGTHFRVSRLATQDSGRLSELACLGLRPGVEVTLQERDSKSGEVQIVMDCHEHTIPGELAILVEGEVVD